MDAAIGDIAAEYGLRKSGSRWCGPCPECGGSAASDKFVLFADGGFKCFACDYKGDAVRWLRTRKGMSCKEAHDALGQGCPTSCPHHGPCREGKPARRLPRRLYPASGAHTAMPVAEAADTGPSEVWQQWMEDLVGKARAALARRPDDIAWLAGRGIPAAAVDCFGLGWLAHDMRVAWADLGLTPGSEDRDRMWIPGGLVIPIRDRDQRLHRVRIRRSAEAREKFLPDRKYQWLKGSGTAPMTLGNRERPRGVVVVEAELDGIAVAHAAPEVFVIALGTVQYGLTGWIRGLCAAAPVILVALDADRQPGAGNKQRLGAGQAAVRRWAATFRQARYWPVPDGKDPGEYAQAGGDLRAWVRAGLPPLVAAPPPVSGHDPALSPECVPRGDGGPDAGLPHQEESGPMARFIALLAAEDGALLNDGEVRVRFRRPAESAESRQRREAIVAEMYKGEAVPLYLRLLPQSRAYQTPAMLAEFFRGA